MDFSVVREIARHLWLLSGSSAQRARANLYGALLNYLRIGRGDDSSMSDTGRLRKANCDVLSSFGDLFVDVVCRDAVSGHDVRKMLALSLLVRFKNIATLISEPELLS